MFNNIIRSLKQNGYEPDIIFDIGAHQGDWTRIMMSIYPNAKYALFEANDHPELNAFTQYNNFKVFHTILNDSKKMVEWYQNGTTGDSMFREKTLHYKNIQPLQRESTTLNDIFCDEVSSNFLKNILVKIDCQGAEIPILKGASNLYDKIDFIILECPFFGQYNENVPSFAEHIAFMDSIGFVVYDFLESHVVNSFNIQVDLLFINKNHHFNIKVQESLMK